MILTLCGSARFEKQYKEWNEKLTLAGHTVFSLSVYPSDKKAGGMLELKGKLLPDHKWYTDEQKKILDETHLRKIDVSHGIVVLNIDGYVGESTAREIWYAREYEKTIYMVDAKVSPVVEKVFGKTAKREGFYYEWAQTLLPPEGPYIDIVFDTGDGLDPGYAQFVEVEYPAGQGVKAGTWIEGGSGRKRLRLTKKDFER